jgi:hypothetical protein
MSALFWDFTQRRLLLNSVSEDLSAPSSRGKQPKDNVIDVTGGLLKQYLQYLPRLYVMQVTLTLSGTAICVNKTAVTSYGKKIRLQFQSLRGFTLLDLTNEN